MCENVPDGKGPASQYAEISISLTSYLAEWERYTSHINSLSDADAVLSSTLTPASEGGRSYSHSHRLDHVEAHSFVSAWDLYLKGQSRRIIPVIGSSEDPAHCARERVCACVCACVCASLRESLPVAHSSMNVSEEDSQ